MSQVSEFNVANASGASVRAEINAILDAIKTLNSGGSDPSNPSSFMPYVDTADNNNLKIRNSSNNGYTTVGSVNETNLGLLAKAGGTMTGQLLGSNSLAASSPAISFDGDTDTGIFRSSANTIGFGTAGVERVQISNSGLDMVDGLPLRFQDSNGSPFVALKAPSSLSSDVTFTLPSVDGNQGEFLTTNGSGVLSFSVVQGVPSGSVFCMAVDVVPTGYLECDGSAVSRTTYAALFAVIGSLYGTGDGSSTFNLPDLRGEFIRGYDNGRGIDNARPLASSQGGSNLSHSHTATSTSNVTDSGHFHTTNVDNANLFPAHGGVTIGYGGSGGYPATNFGQMSTTTTGVTVATSTSVANDGGSETRPRNIAMMYIIKI
mgnify:CR=1 FL=1